MPKKRINATRKTRPISSFNFEDKDFITSIEEMAYNGYYDAEIADKLNIDRYEFSRAKSKFKKVAQALENGRARARARGEDMPSPALFAEVWAKCGRQRSKLMKEFGIGWTKLQSWIAQEPMFADIMAESDLEFLEQLDIAGRILALGGVKDKDQFKGWSRYPSEWMMRFYLNTTGRKYGYGDNPVTASTEDEGIPKNIEQGIDIESWIKQEVSQKKRDNEE